MNLFASSPEVEGQDLYFQEPRGELGHQVANLVKRCPPLDPNSTYCNLLQCEHFSATSCALLTARKELVGFVSGYLVPPPEPEENPDTLFIWQVAVDPSQRGKGLGLKMMLQILSRDMCRNVKFLETTITDDNAASTAMFTKLAREMNAAGIEKSILFDKQKHFLGLHDSEILFRIGPFNR
jgi:L-2,4-diaminobutyric acid acetyltransferase